MRPADRSRAYTKPVLRDLGRMDQVRAKTKPKGGFKNDSNTHERTKLKPF